MTANRSSLSNLADVLRLLRPRIPSALLDGDGWRRVLLCANALPADAVRDGLAFESRLGSPEPAADLGLLAAPGSALCRHFIARAGVADIDAVDIALGALFSEAQRGDSEVSAHVGPVSLEFDVTRDDPPCAVPGVFVSPPEFNGIPATGYTCRERLVAALAAAGCPPHIRNSEAVEKVMAKLPPGGGVTHGGFFPAREPPTLRLNVALAPGGDPAAFLDDAGWPGAPAPALRLLADFRDLTPDFRLCFDVQGGRLTPRLGLEMSRFTKPEGLVHDEAMWRDFIGRLVDGGWCLPEKAAGLRAWPGRSMFWGRAGPLFAYRLFHHFKFDLTDGKTTARAYLFISLQPANPPAED